jgi:hypothetical protein
MAKISFAAGVYMNHFLQQKVVRAIQFALGAGSKTIPPLVIIEGRWIFIQSQKMQIISFEEKFIEHEQDGYSAIINGMSISKSNGRISVTPAAQA